MKKYFANFNANNGTTLCEYRESNNKNELIKSIRDSAKANRYRGNIASWWVCESATGYKVAGGSIFDWGSRRDTPEDIHLYNLDVDYERAIENNSKF